MTSIKPSLQGVEFAGEITPDFEEILTPEAVNFVAKLARNFGGRREELLQRRARRQAEIDAGQMPDFLPETEDIRNSDWTIAPIPDDLQDRRVEITGPVDRKMVINALNSGAKVFMADFEDANSPTWRNMVSGHINLRQAIEGTLTYDSAHGRRYVLEPAPPTLPVRPRGWHLPEPQLLFDSEPAAGAPSDVRLAFLHLQPRSLPAGCADFEFILRFWRRYGAQRLVFGSNRYSSTTPAKRHHILADLLACDLPRDDKRGIAAGNIASPLADRVMVMVVPSFEEELDTPLRVVGNCVEST